MKFDNFHGGHVEMKNLGFPGLPADARHVSDEELASAYSEYRSAMTAKVIADDESIQG